MVFLELSRLIWSLLDPIIQSWEAFCECQESSVAQLGLIFGYGIGRLYQMASKDVRVSIGYLDGRLDFRFEGRPVNRWMTVLWTVWTAALALDGQTAVLMSALAVRTAFTRPQRPPSRPS